MLLLLQNCFCSGMLSWNYSDQFILDLSLRSCSFSKMVFLMVLLIHSHLVFGWMANYFYIVDK